MGDMENVTSSTGADTGSSTTGSEGSGGDSSRSDTGNPGNGNAGGNTGSDTGTGKLDDHGTPVNSGTEAGRGTDTGRTGRSGNDDTGSGGTGNSNGNGTGKPGNSGTAGSGRRGPGRPKGSRNKPKTGSVSASVESGGSQPKKRTPTRRRTSKITPEQVVKGTQQMFGLVSMVRGPHWKVNETEIEPWAADAAELLNRIPPAAFDRFLNASSILAVVAGVGSITVPRAMLDIAMANEAKARKRAAEEARANESDGVETVESSMEAPQEPDNSEARVPVGIFGDMMQEGF